MRLIIELRGMLLVRSGWMCHVVAEPTSPLSAPSPPAPLTRARTSSALVVAAIDAVRAGPRDKQKILPSLRTRQRHPKEDAASSFVTALRGDW
jgi:hypothetical protein